MGLVSVNKTLFEKLEGKKVVIKTIKFYENAYDENLEWIVVSRYVNVLGTESFFELDTGDIINTKYIKSIKVLD